MPSRWDTGEENNKRKMPRNVYGWSWSSPLYIEMKLERFDFFTSRTRTLLLFLYISFDLINSMKNVRMPPSHHKASSSGNEERCYSPIAPACEGSKSVISWYVYPKQQFSYIDSWFHLAVNSIYEIWFPKERRSWLVREGPPDNWSIVIHRIIIEGWGWSFAACIQNIYSINIMILSPASFSVIFGLRSWDREEFLNNQDLFLFFLFRFLSPVTRYINIQLINPIAAKTRRTNLCIL